MSVHNHNEEPLECPLCMELLELDDLNFFPCTCLYQICRFCWHRIRNDENGLCPACRKAYAENPADFTPLSQEELQRIKQEKRQKDQLRKQKVTENRKHLANVRVVQKNLVFVVGLSSRLAEIETLKKSDYFGKFGKIHKVVVNHSTAYAGSQGPSASAYVTYQKAEDALKAIQAVNNIYMDGRTLKASLGTTKYCSHFMKNQQCPKSDCMYLHELGDEAASFTKEEMTLGKHQEFEKRLQEQYLGNSAPTEKPNGLCSLSNNLTNSTSVSIPTGNTISIASSKKSKNEDICKTAVDVVSSNVKEVWPALSASPPSSKETKKTKKSARHEENGKRAEKKEKKIHNKEKNNITNGDRNTPSASCSLDSGNSSASATPPLLQSEASSHSSLFKASSPLPVINVKSTLQYDPESNSSPIGTTPSSLSSCSEPSLSLHNAPTSAPLEGITAPFPDRSNYSCEVPISENNEPVSKNISRCDPSESKTLRLPEENHVSLRWVKLLEKDSAKPVEHWDHLEYNDREDLSVIEMQLDEELGFDPFEETTKALAEEIIIEKNIIAMQRQKELYQQQMDQRTLETLQHRQLMNQAAQLAQSPIKNYLEFGQLSKELSQTRLPPPGFNGVTGTFSHQSHIPKLSQSFMGGMNSHQNMTNTSSPPPQQINGFIGSNNIGVPPGLANNILSAPPSNALHGLMGNGLPAHNITGPSLLNFDTSFGMAITPPIHPNIKPNNETFAIKDLENSLNNIRNIRPIITSVSSMNSVNNMNNLATGNTNTQVHLPSQNPLANLLNFAHQQHPSFSSQQSQQNIFHQFGSSAISAHKGWNNSGPTDLTALDPAIVLSGQLTDSRTDSPPHWMKNVDQLGNEGHSWNNILPCNIISGNLPGTFNGVLPPQTQQRTSMWPPTSPPPGFNSISPLHAKQREAHKIENL